MLALFATAAAAAEPLVWKWAQGDSSRYLMTQSMSMSMNAGPVGKVESQMTQSMLMEWVADAVDESGEAKVRQKTDRIVMNTTGPMGQGFTYDSASDDAPVGMAAMVAPMFDAMVDGDFLLTMLPSGEVTAVELSDELREAFDKLPGGAMSSKSIEQMSKQGSLKFPATPLEVGQEWTNTAVIEAPQIGPMKVETTYKYLGPKQVGGRTLEAFEPRVTITPPEGGAQAVKTSIETKGSSGEILFDRAKGRVVKSQVRQQMEVRVEVGGQTMVNTIDQTVEMRALADGEEPDLAPPPESKQKPAEKPAEKPANAPAAAS
jgi:hypothetical protein